MTTMLAQTILAAVLLLPAFGGAQAPPRMPGAPEYQRAEKLQILAEVWGLLALHHPFLAHHPIDWDAALAAAVAPVEGAGTAEELADALNATLLARLGDPLTYARSIRQADSVPRGYPQLFGARLLASRIGYLSAPDPVAYGQPGFADQVRSAISGLGPLEMLVVDLRWSTDNAPRNAYRWLGVWADSSMTPGVAVSVLRTGPDQLLTWRSVPNPPLPASGAAVGTPTVFVTNLASYSSLEPALDALQRRSDVAVVLETAGPLPEDWDVVTLAGGVRLRVRSPMLVSTSGSLGSRPDRIASAIDPQAELESLRALLGAAVHAPAAVLPRFDFTYRPPPRDTSGSELSREERIAGLLKVWHLIRNHQAYLDYAEIDWSRVLPEWIPRVERAASLREYYLTLRQLTAPLNDSHVVVDHPTVSEPEWSIPSLLMRVQEKVLVARVDSAVAANTRLTRGDEVIAVDGRSVQEIEAQWRAQRSASTPGSFLRNVWEWGFAVRGEKETPVVLTVAKPNGVREEVTVRRSANWLAMYRDAPFWYGRARILPGNIGYMSPYAIRDRAAFDSVFASLVETRGMILDLRQRSGPEFTGGYSLVRPLLDAFVDHPVAQRKGSFTLFTMHQTPPMRARTQTEMVHVPQSSPPGGRYSGPVVVLLNARQQSYGEEVILVLRAAERFTFVGSPTAGTNGGAPAVALPRGGAITFTYERVENNDGSRFHGVGIVPDVFVQPTVEGVRAGRDEVLATGIEVLHGILSGTRPTNSGSTAP